MKQKLEMALYTPGVHCTGTVFHVHRIIQNSHCLCFKLPATATAGSAGIRLGERERESQRYVVASRVRGRLTEAGLVGDM